MLPNVILFLGMDSNNCFELWETNGTAAGTVELTGVTGANALGLYPIDLTPYNAEEVLFCGYDSSGYSGLWETNGTAVGTHELTGIAGAFTAGIGFDPTDLTVFNGHVLFSGYDSQGQAGLWETDGTSAGTHELTVPGALTTPQGLLPGGLNPSNLSVLNGYVVFAGDDASGRVGLWETDGTASGTHELSGIAGAATLGQGIGPPGLLPTDLMVFNDQILFAGNDANGQTGLWETDGTASGTHELTGIAAAFMTGLDPTDLTVFNDHVLFSGYDAQGQTGLWESDGTASGTHELTGIAGAFTAGIGFDPTDLTIYNANVLFNGYDSQGHAGLWETDGTAAGTHELAGIVGASTTGIGLAPADFTVFNGNVLFVGSDAQGQVGLWETDGSVAGTYELTDIAGASSLTGLAPFGLTAIGTPELVAGGSTPVLAAGARANYVAGAAPVTLDAGLSISDTESTGLTGATVSIGEGFLAGDALSVGSPQAGIASNYNAAAGVLTLSGAASLAAYQMELDSVAFASPTTTSPSRTIAWSVNDGLTTSSPASSSVSVGGDPPAQSRIVWQNSGGQGAIWEMNGLNLAGGGPVTPNPGSAWHTIGTGDFFGGGDSDLLWQSSGGSIAIWEMNGNTIIGGGTVAANPGPAWHAVGTGDFNNDGLSDILLQNTSGQVAVWQMNRTSIVGGGVVSSNPGSSWKAVGSGDFNDDGHSDILFQNASSGQVAIWDMNGNSVIGGGTVSANPGPSWHAIGTGDFNGDGHSDILFQNPSSGQVAIWEMNGNTLIGGGTVSANPGPSWHAIGTGGGGSDILLQSTSGQATIWDMSGTSIIGGGAVSLNAGPSWKAIGLT
jgi:ELWxxDGT repeat protein